MLRYFKTLWPAIIVSLAAVCLPAIAAPAVTSHDNTRAPIIWNDGSLVFTKTATGQTDCITVGTCLTRSTVLYNSVVESPSGMQPCPGYIGPANTEWAYGDIANWAILNYQPLFDTIGCSPPSMVGVPMVAHLMSEDIYLQVTFNSWQQGGGNFRYTRTTNPQANTASTAFDFDGDSKTDVSIFRPGAGEWWYLRSSDGADRAFAFGTNTDKMVPADYTGDGISDFAFWRPASGEWFVLRSDNTGFYSFPFGTTGDIPAPGDFDGDGIDDPTVYRPSTGVWFIRRSSDNQTEFVPFGAATDFPLVADYDGDGMSDIAVYKPGVSQFWQLRSTNGLAAYQFGSTGDKAMAADFTGDGAADVVFWRPPTGEWFVLRSEDDGFFSFPYGISTDIPSPGDYDGDGTTDFAVFRPSTSTWYIQGSTSGYVQYVFGQASDLSVPNSFVVP